MNKQVTLKKRWTKRKIIISTIALVLIIAIILNWGFISRLLGIFNSRVTSEIYLQTENETKLISPGINEGIFATPCISPSGDEVVFHGAIKGYSRIWKYTKSTDTLIPLTAENYVAVEPSYSWDGKYITFAADRGIDQKRMDMFKISNNLFLIGTIYLGGNPETFNIYIMNSDGTNLRQLTNWGAIDMRPAFSSNSKNVIFMSTHKSGTIKKRDLYTVSIEGNGEPQLIPNSEGANRPWYSKDGEWIYYWKEIDNRGTLSKMKSDGSEWQPIAEDKGGIGSHGPFIDPNGEWIWFHSVRDKDDPMNQLFKMSIEGGPFISVTPEGFEREHLGHVTAAINGRYSFDVLKVLDK